MVCIHMQHMGPKKYEIHIKVHGLTIQNKVLVNKYIMELENTMETGIMEKDMAKEL